MKHFIAHHSHDVMGYSSTMIGNPCVRTGKDVNSLNISRGDVVWLTASEKGAKTKYYIASRFVVQQIEQGIYPGPKLQNLVSGSGLLFKLSVPITDTPLYARIKDHFGLGMRELTDNSLISELESEVNRHMTNSSAL